MKKIILLILCFTFLPLTNAFADIETLAERLSGRILLQVESYGRAWYVYPENLTRYYLRDGDEAYQMMRNLSKGISNNDLQKIPQAAGQNYNSELVDRFRGYILLQIEEHGEAWYVNPVDGLRYYLKDGQTAYNFMRDMGLGITTSDLRKIPMNDTQVEADTAFESVAYASLSNNDFDSTSYGDTILPLASLTKLMTALVVLDTNPDWNRVVTITQKQIDYPKLYVGNDYTSEVALKAGDQVKIKDLWVSLLVASSNQSAAILADSTGYTFGYFVDLMNQKAKELGLTKTRFVDVAGLDAHNVSTPKEFAILANHAFSFPKIANESVIESYCFDTTNTARTVNITNRNYSLLAFSPDGAKTGYLVEAQRNVALQKNGQTIVIMHARSMYERNTIIEDLLN